LAELGKYPALNLLAAGGVNRMRDIGVKLDSAVRIADSAIVPLAGSTLIAVMRAEVVLEPALRTMTGEFSAGHRHKRSVGPANDLEIADDERVIEGDRAEGLQPVIRVFHQLDAYFGDFHTRSPG
jgi:hypothetical protein